MNRIDTNNTKQIVWAGTTITSADTEPQSNFGICVEGDRIVATGLRDQLQDLRTQPVPQRQNEAFSFSSNAQNDEISFQCVSPTVSCPLPRCLVGWRL